MGNRRVPERTHTQQRDADRLKALRTGTPEAVRAWAKQYDISLIEPEDDALLSITIHEARAVLFTGKVRKKSQTWLAENKARIMAAREVIPNA